MRALSAAPFSLVVLASPCVARAVGGVDYKLKPTFQGVIRDALEVRMLLRADSSGRIVLDLPNKGRGRERHTQ
jgi:hypothetical protein